MKLASSQIGAVYRNVLRNYKSYESGRHTFEVAHKFALEIELQYLINHLKRKNSIQIVGLIADVEKLVAKTPDTTLVMKFSICKPVDFNLLNLIFGNQALELTSRSFTKHHI